MPSEDVKARMAAIAAAFKGVAQAKAEITSAVDRLAKAEDLLDKLRPNDAEPELQHAMAAVMRAIGFCAVARTDK